MQSAAFKEWFWSKASAERAAARLAARGYETKVRYAMRADGTHDWLLEAA